MALSCYYCAQIVTAAGVVLPAALMYPPQTSTARSDRRPCLFASLDRCCWKGAQNGIGWPRLYNHPADPDLYYHPGEPPAYSLSEYLPRLKTSIRPNLTCCLDATLVLGVRRRVLKAKLLCGGDSKAKLLCGGDCRPKARCAWWCLTRWCMRLRGAGNNLFIVYAASLTAGGGKYL